jgi:hypothetical protein
MVAAVRPFMGATADRDLHTLNLVFADVDESCWRHSVGGEIVHHCAGSMFLNSKGQCQMATHSVARIVNLASTCGV